MEKDHHLDVHQKELQLLPPSTSSCALSWLTRPTPTRRPKPPRPPPVLYHHHDEQPSLDLKLSISLGTTAAGVDPCVEALRWQAAEQIRLAAIEKAYAERVRELTRREIELAQNEFARARAMWDKAREEVAKAERLRHEANSCMGEITCHSCRQRFRPPS